MLLVKNCRVPGKKFVLLSIQYTDGNKTYNVKDTRGKKYSFDSSYCSVNYQSEEFDK